MEATPALLDAPPLSSVRHFSPTDVVTRPPFLRGSETQPEGSWRAISFSVVSCRRSGIAHLGSSTEYGVGRLLLSELATCTPGHLGMHSLISPVKLGVILAVLPARTHAHLHAPQPYYLRMAHRFALPGAYIVHLVAPSPSLWKVQSHSVFRSLTIKVSRLLASLFPIQDFFSTVSVALQASHPENKIHLPIRHGFT